MIDVSDRSVSLRRATAEARITMRPETIDMIRNGEIPKGNVGEITRAAGLLGLKQTPQLLPFCHVITLDHAEISVEYGNAEVIVRLSVTAIARTGVEVEAMTGASIAALNVYDMVKPVDSEAAIGEVRVLAKSGGRGQFRQHFDRAIRAGILVISDSVAAGKAEDSAGAAVRENLEIHGVETPFFEIVADECEAIAARVVEWTDKEHLDLVLAVGGTGLGPRDQTPEALRPVLDREIPGVTEAIRAHGRDRTPYAALSRGLAGQRKRSLVMALPGSKGGATESMQAVMPWILHTLKVFDADFRHHEAT